MLQIIVKPKKVSLLFLSAVLFLTLVHSVLLTASFIFTHTDISALVNLFDLDIENNIPSLYSAFSILMCALLFLVILMHQKKPIDYEKLCWFGLFMMFAFLSLDEWFQIHENIGDITENYINSTGFLYFPWVVPYGFAVSVIFLLYLKFIIRLPRMTAILFILSGILYLTGAVVFDMLGGRESELHGFDSITYCVLYTIEEFLEMIGIVLLIYTLLSYIDEQFGSLCISLQIKQKS